MPIYDYECKECGHEFEFPSSVKNRRMVVCEKCDGETQIVIKKGAGPVDLNVRKYPYWDYGMGCEVRSPGDRKQKMRERGFIEIGDQRPDTIKPEVKNISDMVDGEAVEQAIYDANYKEWD